jgi:hypothetical protein
MTMAHLADFYVNIIEPFGKLLFFIIIAVFLLFLLNLIRGTSKDANFTNSVVNLIVKILKGTVTYTGRFLVWLSKVLLKTTIVIFASIRDFFISKI